MSKVEEGVVDNDKGVPMPAGTEAVVDLHLSAGSPIDESKETGVIALSLDAKTVPPAEVMEALTHLTTSSDCSVAVALELTVKNSISQFELGGICGALQTAHDAALDAMRGGGGGGPSAFQRDTGYAGRLELMPFMEGGQQMLRVTGTFSKPDAAVVDGLLTEMGINAGDRVSPSARLEAHLKLRKSLGEVLGSHTPLDAAPTEGDFEVLLHVERSQLDVIKAALRGKIDTMLSSGESPYSYRVRPLRDMLMFSTIARACVGGTLRLELDSLSDIFHTMAGPSRPPRSPLSARDTMVRDFKRSPGVNSRTALNFIENIRTSFESIRRVKVVSKRPSVIATLDCVGVDPFGFLPDRVEIARPIASTPDAPPAAGSNTDQNGGKGKGMQTRTRTRKGS